jgi:hypothetical protein
MTAQRLTLEQALRVAIAMRELRNVELDDARECHEDLATAIEHGLPAAVCERYRERVRAHVAAARKWNRQLLIAMHAVRDRLIERQIGRRYVLPVSQAVVQKASARGALARAIVLAGRRS